MRHNNLLEKIKIKSFISFIVLSFYYSNQDLKAEIFLKVLSIFKQFKDYFYIPPPLNLFNI